MSSILRQIFSKKSLFLRNDLIKRCAQPSVLSRLYSPSWGPPPPKIDKKEIEFRVLKTLGKHDKIDLNSIKVDSLFSKDLGLDSLDLIECLVELEDEFEMEFNDRQMDEMLSVKSVVQLICEEMSKKVDQNQRPDIEFGENATMNRPVN